MRRGVQLQTSRARRPTSEPRRASERSITFEVELVYDPESDGWVFRVPSLGIVGGDKTRAAAVLRAREAIAFTIEGEEGSAPPAGVELIYIPARLGARPHRISA